MPRTAKTPPLPRERAFRSNKRIVRYAGHRWLLVADRGKWLFLQRGRVSPIAQWVPAAACR